VADSSELRFKHLRPPTLRKETDELAPDQQPLDLEPLESERPQGRFSRRSFLSGLGATGLLAGAPPLVQAAPTIEPAVESAGLDGTDELTLRVNGKDYKLPHPDPRATLLDTLRERLHLTGTKKGATMASAEHAPCTSMGGA